MKPALLLLFASLVVASVGPTSASGTLAAEVTDGAPPEPAEEPAPGTSDEPDEVIEVRVRERRGEPADWLRPPFRDHFLEPAHDRDGKSRFDLLFDYNRVDRLKLGGRLQIHDAGAMMPRMAIQAERAFGRNRSLYGAQLEQPVAPDGLVALGATLVRRTDHNELQLVENWENSLALLFARQDYRDYFEREGAGGYLLVRLPGLTSASVHVRRDDYRSLAVDRRTRSFFHRDRELRENPAVDEGRARSVAFRLDRIARRTHRMVAGLYHAVSLERAGHGLGGDFDYTRALADVRSIVRLSPATTLALRGVAGHTIDGVLPVQKRFPLGGVDGLRGHPFGAARGDQVALAQAEYSIGLWTLSSGMGESGLHAIAFVDAGQAWFNPRHRWDVERQRFAVDGGFGISTSDDNMRLYFAKDLRDDTADFIVSLRLQRPF